MAFINKQDLQREISKAPLLVYKLGLTICIWLQLIGYLEDAKLIFSDQGVFPDGLVTTYFPSHLLSYGERGGVFVLLMLFLLSLSALTCRFQKISFFLIALLEIILIRRNFIFVNSGDLTLIYFSLMASLTPVATWSTRNEPVIVLQVLPLWLLHSVIYSLNFIAKISSAWGVGTGLLYSLNHTEMLRWPVTFSPATLLVLNYISVLVILTAAVSALISPRCSLARSSTAILLIGYHLCANLVLNLSWLSFPFIFLEVAMVAWPARNINGFQSESTGHSFHWQQKLALILIAIGFFGIREAGDIVAFDDRDYILLGHNWYMFAPPPRSTGEWQAVIAGPSAHTIDMAELKKDLHFFLFQHEYKYFFNLRRSELIPVSRRLSQKLCEIHQYEKPSSIQLVYSGHLFDKAQDFEIKYEAIPCSDINGPNT
jgi:hypothetical protein